MTLHSWLWLWWLCGRWPLGGTTRLLIEIWCWIPNSNSVSTGLGFLKCYFKYLNSLCCAVLLLLAISKGVPAIYLCYLFIVIIVLHAPSTCVLILTFFYCFILFAFSLSQSRLFNCINRLGPWLFVSAVNRQMIWLEIVVDYQRFVFFLPPLFSYFFTMIFSQLHSLWLGPNVNRIVPSFDWGLGNIESGSLKCG